MCKHMLRCCPKMESLGLLALRLVVGFIFIYQGYGKLFVNTAGTIGMFSTWGIPMPEVMAYVVGALELLGGLMVLLGIYARYAAAWLAVIMIVALLTAHRGGPVAGMFLPLSLLGSALALVGVGAGDYRLLKSECCCPKCKMGDKDGGSCCGAGQGMCCGDEMKMGEMKK